MGQIGRWIDSLDDASRDRIIQHPDPTYHGRNWWNFDHECGCLVGCTVPEDGWRTWQSSKQVNLVEAWRNTSSWDVIPRRLAWHDEGRLRPCEEVEVGKRFPVLTQRFTPERMWRLVKARAAKANRVVLPAVAEEAALA